MSTRLTPLLYSTPSNHTSRMHRIWPDRGVLLPRSNWKRLARMWVGGWVGGGDATSRFHLQYLQLNKHFVSSSVLHACEFQITQRLKRTLQLKWFKAERRKRGLKDPPCFTFTLPPDAIGCNAWINSQIRRGIQSGLWGSCAELVSISVDCWLTQKRVEHGARVNACYPARTDTAAALWCSSS